MKVGDLIWERGLLKKGNGICHGICGNGFALHSLYRFTKDKIWLSRSLQFAIATFDKNVQKIC